MRRKAEQKRTFEYDLLGRLWKCYDWFGVLPNDCRVTITSYDFLNRKTEERIESGEGELLHFTRYGYDPDGNQTELITSSGRTLTEYNASGEPIKITDPEGNISYIFYDYQHKDCYGQTVLKKTTVDPLGNQIITIMNTQNQPASILRKNSIGELLAKKELFYDGIRCSSTCETVIAPNAPMRSVWTRWTYDEAGNLLSLTEALGTPEEKTTRYEYNNAGQKQAIITPDGTKILHAYDPLGRVSAVSATDSSFSYTYSYDKNHNLIEVRDSLTNEATSRCYDKNGNMIHERLGNGLEMGYGYDRLGRLVLQILPDQSSIATSYNCLYMKSVSRISPEGEILYTHTYNSYDLSGNLLSSSKPQNLGEATFSYDPNDRIKKWESSGTAWGQALSYDCIGNLIQSEYKDPLGSVASNFTYNDLTQLKSESGIANHTYEIDSLYNCINKDGNPYIINSLNQLLYQSAIDYTYDKNGNLIASCQKSFSYDAYDRLISVTEGEQTVTYAYDAFNRRLSKRLSCSDQSTTTLYLYQDQNEIGACNKERKLVELRLLGIGKGAEIGAAIAFELNGTLSIPIHDNNGNVVGLIDSSGNVLESYRYCAYGIEELYKANGEKITASSNPWRYASKRYDPETGFLYFGRRYYDPGTSRWTTADPAGYEAGPNLYAYVLNNPLTHFDLYGLIDEEDGSIHGPYRSFFDEWATSSSRSGMAWDFCKHSAGGFFEGCIAKWARDPIGSYNQFGKRGYIDRNSTDWRQSTRYASESLGESTTMGAALFGTDVAISAAMPLILGARFLQSGISFLSQGIKSLISGLRPIPSNFQEVMNVTYNEMRAGKQIWSSTKTRTSVENAFGHWKNHGHEFSDIQNVKQYVEKAWNFFKSPPIGTLSKVRSNGDKILYHLESNTFGVGNSQGIPKTLFKPDPNVHKRASNLEYFYDQ